MAVDMVNIVTNEKLKEMDWAKSIEICELVVHDPGQAKVVIKSIRKRLVSKNGNTQLYAVMLLEMLINNCGEHIHKQVIDNGLLPILVGIVKKKQTDLPVRERIFLLLDAAQTALGGVSGKHPEYYAAYYDLVAARVQFPIRPHTQPPEPSPRLQVINTPAQEPIHQKVVTKNQPSQTASDLSVIQKAAAVLEILREVLNNMDSKHPEGASDEFVLDLVEQCSFHQQRIMHLLLTSQDEKMADQAVELNEKLLKILEQHNSLLSVCASSSTQTSVIGEDEEEDEERRCLRKLKGKACADGNSDGRGKHLRSNSGDKIQRAVFGPLFIQEPSSVAIPPPPAKHRERERFFNEKPPHLNRHMRGLSLDTPSASATTSFHNATTDFSDKY